MREPVLNFTHWARAFEVSPATAENEWWLLYDSGNSADYIGQMPFQSLSVFNFYRPGFVPTGTEAGAMGLTVPEFQILLDGNRAGYINMMSEYIFDRTYGPNGDADSFRPDYSAELELVEDPEALADHLDRKLLAGRMSEKTREALTGVVEAIPVRTNTPDNTERDHLSRVRAAVTVAVTAPEYMVR